MEKLHCRDQRNDNTSDQRYTNRDLIKPSPILHTLTEETCSKAPSAFWTADSSTHNTGCTCPIVPPDHLLLDRSHNIAPLISRWELHKYKNCWNKSFRNSKILTLLCQQFSNLLISQQEMSGPRLGALSNNRWSGDISWVAREFSANFVTPFTSLARGGGGEGLFDQRCSTSWFSWLLFDRFAQLPSCDSITRPGWKHWKGPGEETNSWLGYPPIAVQDPSERIMIIISPCLSTFLVLQSCISDVL